MPAKAPNTAAALPTVTHASSFPSRRSRDASTIFRAIDNCAATMIPVRRTTRQAKALAELRTPSRRRLTRAWKRTPAELQINASNAQDTTIAVRCGLVR